jgi:hypothetical protein
MTGQPARHRDTESSQIAGKKLASADLDHIGEHIQVATGA